MSGWHLHGEGDAAYIHRPAAEGCNIAGCRPVVVIDPSNGEDVSRVVGAIAANHSTADALRSLIQPPRPDEPQLLAAVVEDDRGELWVRIPESVTSKPWRSVATEGALHAHWSMVHAVKVLSPGLDA